MHCFLKAVFKRLNELAFEQVPNYNKMMETLGCWWNFRPGLDPRCKILVSLLRYFSLSLSIDLGYLLSINQLNFFGFVFNN